MRAVDVRPLRATAVVMLALLAVAAVGLLTDDRTLLGDPIWLKPAKFAISSFVYAVSMMLILGTIRGREQLVHRVSTVTGAALLIEVALITLQAQRGVRSHFNIGTLFDGAVFIAMAVAIIALWLASVWVLIALAGQTFDNRPWGLALTWAMFVTVIGSGLGGLMTTPRSKQLDAMRFGGPNRELGGHAVGVPDGGDGLPLLGWATGGGDLRVGHFFGLHALQILPLIGLVVLRLTRRRSTDQQTQMIHIVSASYLAIILLLTFQALQSEPLLAPGPLTIAALAVVIVGAVAAAATSLRSGDHSPGVSNQSDETTAPVGTGAHR